MTGFFVSVRSLIATASSAIYAAFAASGGSALLGYLAQWAGSVATTQKQINDERLSVFRFMTPAQIAGCVDASVDVTLPVQTAYAAARAIRKSLAGMVNAYSAPAVHFPEGYKYLITGSVPVGTGIRTEGAGAIVTSGAYPYPQTVSLFTGVGPDCGFNGLSTLGFIDVIQIATANLDAATVDIRDCTFHEWSGIAINVDNNSASTLLRIQGNKFYPRLASAMVLKNQCDVCLFDDNWVEGPCDTFFWNFKVLHIRGLLGVPTASTAGSRWVLNQGTAFTASKSRFGGEAGARTIVDQNTGPGGANATKLIITDCETWATGFPMVRFGDIPDVFIFEQNYGLTGAYPFSFGVIPAATRNGLGSRNTWRVGDNEQRVLGGLRSSADDVTSAVKTALVQTLDASLSTETMLASNVVRNILHTEAGYTPTGSLGAGMTSGAGTDIYGAATQTINGVNGASNFNTAWSTILTGLAAGPYTMLVNVEVLSNNIVQFNAHAGQNARQENLSPGKYTLAVPFYFDGTNSTAAGYSFVNLCAGGQVSHGGLRIISGRVDGYKRWNTEVYADAAPVAGYWRRGDRVIRLTPAAGQPKAWTCTVAGTPGTWVSEGNL